MTAQDRPDQVIAAAQASVRAVLRLAAENGTGGVGVAVSGGGDSIALLRLAALEARALGLELRAATVDHRLRPESREEAAFVADTCHGMGLAHSVLVWEGAAHRGNLMAAARRARRALLGEWARGSGLQMVLLGHTASDQAETVLMALARAAGVDGLSAMREVEIVEGLRWARPLLQTPRTALRVWLSDIDQRWIDDPTNEDLRFERIRVRRALPGLASIGLDERALGRVAENMQQVRAWLEHETRIAMRRIARVEAGDLLLDKAGFVTFPAELQRRILVQAMRWMVREATPPRGPEAEALRLGLVSGRKQTLHGLIAAPFQEQIRLTREYRAVRDLECPTTQIWDGRWQLSGPHAPHLRIRALGATRAPPDGAAPRLPRATLMSSPAIWDGTRLMAAPIAGYSAGWQALIHEGGEDFGVL